jgi:kynureninase
MISKIARDAMKPEDYLEFLAPDEIRIRQQHQQEVEQYLAEWRSQTERLQTEQDLNPSPGIARLHKRKTGYIQANQAIETK